MRTYSWAIFLLSFLTSLLSFNVQHMAYGSTSVSAAPASRPLLAAQTQTSPNPSPPRGKERRTFNQLQEIGCPRLL